MAQPHAKSGDLVNVRPLGAQLKQATTTAIIKADNIELVRVVLPAGKELPQHQVPGEITVQCVEGRVAFGAHGKTQTLSPGDLVYLAGGVPHSLKGIDDASLLLTIALVPN